MAKSKNSSQHNQSKKAHKNGYGRPFHPQSRAQVAGRISHGKNGRETNIDFTYSIKKPKTHRYPSLKGTDPKFRRNHRHALHGTMKALKEVKEGKRDSA
ncbi:60S ribosomal protein L29 [Exophiala dermatitidis]|uniref:60S ribosomal protein L29 n=2 Tax=Exophiala dermatitidis TaxID=5970 RepID=H6BST3_EXODN|nr:50S ribosomal protein L29e [Exophiala dermatitidis NIH/UT8656]KAJ4505831.1 60S ribosomal protein L29 [Exophiala dermatitidis]EHY54237.1 50S ribosomal protein L29e [Exophiala dermatitidis NIH/UT8656]KAJ4507970.1 60S ribosomal protein L29 [Exophiala dermatitidis]KAJ4513619.1 60S ribosomal protein L29 [Exophiala dermatitidis]KAJ4535535.1 60S ribosomal protein L29 [Exophiala dermatitidis]